MDSISFSEWQKLDLRVGKILNIEEIKGADKLYKLEVEIGEENPRTIVAGIKGYYNKDELVGKQIIVICNLEPRIMKGIKSQGMLLAAVEEDEKQVILLQPEKEIATGSKVT